MNAATEFKQLSGILFKIHNPQVAMAYGDQPFLRKVLLIRTADNFTTIALKIFIFYLVCGRINTAATVPMYWPTKVQKVRAQLAIAFRPETRRRIKFGKYDPNMQCHIPHYNGSQSPKIPSYTVGVYSCRVTLTDQSTILINGESETEAQRVVDALLKYVEPKFIPKEIHYVHTKRKGIKLEGQKVRPFRADYYPPATQTPQWSIQL